MPGVIGEVMAVELIKDLLRTIYIVVSDVDSIVCKECGSLRIKINRPSKRIRANDG